MNKCSKKLHVISFKIGFSNLLSQLSFLLPALLNFVFAIFDQFIDKTFKKI